MYDFNTYDDANEVKKYDGFIDRNGYFYKVSRRGKPITDKNGNIIDSHNNWAQAYLKEKLHGKKFNFSPTTSALFALTKLSGPAEILIHCFGFVYYSHDPIYYKPIIKVPDPKFANYKITEEQLNMLFTIMTLNNENTNIGIFFGEDNYDYDDTSLENIKRL